MSAPGKSTLEVAVLGAGAMGSLFGGRLASRGHRVRLLTTNVAHRQAVDRDGLTLVVAGTIERVSVEVALPDAPGEPPDLIILFTKTHQSEKALTAARHLIGQHTQVMTVQNGLGNLERIAPFVPVERVILGTSNLPADFAAPGRIVSDGGSITRIARASGVRDAFVQRIAETLSDAGIPTECVDDIQRSIWEKAAFNVAMNPTLALGQATPGTLGRSPQALELALAAASEACAVAQSEGVTIDEGPVHQHILWACANHPDHRPSMRQDMDAGRPTEIDALCGEVVRRGLRNGIGTPVNDALWRLVNLRDSR